MKTRKQLIKETRMNIETEEDEGTKKQYVYTIKDKVLMLMKPNTKFHFIGKLKIYVLYGSVDIFGYTCIPSGKSHEVYSPKCYSFIPIRNVTSSDKTVYNWKTVETYLKKEEVDLTLQNSLSKHLEECKSAKQGKWAIILLQNLENTMTTFLNKFCPYRLFPKIENSSSYQWNDIRKAEIVLQSHLRLNNEKGQDISMNPRWRQEVALNFVKKDLIHDAVGSNYNTRCRFMIFGGGGVGKSTVVRYLINESLQHVLKQKIILLDLDPGQTEFTVSGSISLNIIDKPLLGPNFTHLTTPYYEIALGEISISQCVPRYLTGVAKLVEVLNTDEKLKDYSVIVNTMGFNKGIGMVIACSIIKILQPTDVIQIEAESISDNFKNHLKGQFVDSEAKHLSWIGYNLNQEQLRRRCSYDFAVIPAFEKIPHNDNKKTKLLPFQHREIVTFSYLSQITKDLKHALYDVSRLSINNVTPYSIPFSSIYISLIHIVPATHVLSVINGNIVALCGVNVEETQNNTNTEEGVIRVLVRPPVTTCYGYGITRGIDIENKLIFINTPLKLTTLRHVNCLMGCTPTPKELLELDEQEKSSAGGNIELPTSRNTRRGFFHAANFIPKKFK